MNIQECYLQAHTVSKVNFEQQNEYIPNAEDINFTSISAFVREELK